MARSPAARRYLKRFMPVMLAYVIVLFGVSWLIKATQPAGVALAALSVLPALPIIAVIIVIGLYIAEETDEYLRQRIVTAMLFGIGVVLSASTVLGFLQMNDVIGPVQVFWGFPAWCAAWGLAQCWMGLRERMAGGGSE
ncbi:hypothetical protein [Sphingomonas sp. G-3-2-10]|uniref:hypothetical protein n=1 Tax=Sphingomonas sp. G-3-2-10 TaxID=2728838 RepID=UPI00146CD6AE|nr:hypothetical protein [Sphingomonas sp. G-3-2-10]NML07415.1 hypothetical protein [Sphingomonas sp. G-3-2-10]